MKRGQAGKQGPAPKKSHGSRKKKGKKDVNQYLHKGAKRSNNPPAGLVTQKTDPDQPSKKYSFDPHLDPHLQWSGKQENSEIHVDTVSLHEHERIDPHTILEKVVKEEQTVQKTLVGYFDDPENILPIRNAVEFYKHDQNWVNRLIAGDSLLVMNSLLEKEGMEGKIQMIYIDPPYGIKYGSNFQPFINKHNVTDGKDEDLTQEPEMIKAFRDTWELGIHSYLSYLQDRLLLSKQLLNEHGSIFVQISDKNLHHVREIMDEIFGAENFVSVITFRTKGVLGAKYLAGIADYLIWYSKDIEKLKMQKIFTEREVGYGTPFIRLELPDKTRRIMTADEKKNPQNIPKNIKIFCDVGLVSAGTTPSCMYDFQFEGKNFSPKGKSWKTNESGMKNLIGKNRITMVGKTPRYVFYHEDYPVQEITNVWIDSQGASDKKYVVQTSDKIIQRCMLMATQPGDIVLDPTCGSGTTSYVAEKWGRRWITCDTSRIAVAIARQRIMTSKFEYYELFNAKEGVLSGFQYKKIPHVTLGTIANNEPKMEEVLYDQPLIDNSKTRISGPFTVEAVPAPTVKSIDELSGGSENRQSQASLSHQNQWRDELYHAGIRGKGGQKIEFSRVDTHPTTKWLHAEAETKEKNPKRVMVSFGPEHAPIEQRQVENAINDAQTIIPKPQIIIFAAMQFDPEASKDIEELNWPDVTVLKVEMNKDLLTSDLKKKRSTNESFWLMGQPDIELEKTEDEKYVIRVNGFDYYNTKTDEIDSGGASKIAMWMLDTDYDGRSIYPQQVFFPMDGKDGGWDSLAKTLHAQIDEDLIIKYQGTESIPFEAGPNKKAAVKIIDDRGIESLKLIDLM